MRILLLLSLVMVPTMSAQETPSWIWSAKDAKAGELVRFRREFDVPFAPHAASLTFTCDDRAKVWINDTLVASSTDWKKPVTLEVGQFLRQGATVLSVEARNNDAAAGLLLQLTVSGPAGVFLDLVTDGSWHWGPAPGGEWHKKGFDERGWRQAIEVGPYSCRPWGFVLNNAQGKEPGATPASELSIPPGFKVELVYTVDNKKDGSWVSLAVDGKGRLYSSSQHKKGLFRITPATVAPDGVVHVEKFAPEMGKAQGLLWHQGGLYVVVNGSKVLEGPGLYRLSDSDNDGFPDQPRLLRRFDCSPGSEHGPHAVIPAPDGQSLYIVAGNHTKLPHPESSAVPRVWNEDNLLPRIWDPRGHAVGIKAPGGWVCRTDLQGKKWELVCVGFRNSYDIAFNQAGDLFTFDADMEWDVGTPWYRATRICHVMDGGEFGWRSGTGKWPEYYPDNLPPVVELGASSPTGVMFADQARFPARYRKALYALDWTYGTIYAVHLEPDGASYSGTLEKFVTGRPLPVTDAVVNPVDGAMYFTVGGRGVQSALYRVTWSGELPFEDPTEGVVFSPAEHAALQTLPKAHEEDFVKRIWPYLGHHDRFVRFGARTQLEHRPVSDWQERALAEQDTRTLMTSLLATARTGGNALRPGMIRSLGRLDWDKLDNDQRLDLIRIYGLVCVRMGRPDPDTCAQLAALFNPRYPHGDPRINRELSRLLAYLGTVDIVPRTLALLRNAPKQEDAIHYALVLRVVETGWSRPDREEYFRWLRDAEGLPGGASIGGFIKAISKEAMERVGSGDRPAMEAILANRGEKPPLPNPRGPGREWKTQELVNLVNPGLRGRNFQNGRRMFDAARCVSCHRFDNRGEAIGPDLTGVAGRFNVRDLLTTIVEPSKVISDQYRATIIQTGRKLLTGRVLRESTDALFLMEDPYEPDTVSKVLRKDIRASKPSMVSVMPVDLLNPLNRDEVLDLLAYLLSGGNRSDPMFSR